MIVVIKALSESTRRLPEPGLVRVLFYRTLLFFSLFLYSWSFLKRSWYGMTCPFVGLPRIQALGKVHSWFSRKNCNVESWRLFIHYYHFRWAWKIYFATWNISTRQWGSLSGVGPAYTPLSCTAKLLVQFSPLMIASLGADERINTFPPLSGMRPIKHHPDVNTSEEHYFATLIDIATAV